MGKASARALDVSYKVTLVLGRAKKFPTACRLCFCLNMSVIKLTQ